MNATARLLLAFLAAACIAESAFAAAVVADPAVRDRDRARLDAALGALATERPGLPDLYVIGVAGDGSVDVFRNEVLYLETLMKRRFQTENRVLTLINHVDYKSDAGRPLATMDNLQVALKRVGELMDPEQDILLLFLTMHGTRNHLLFLRLDTVYWNLINPDRLRFMLDQTAIRNRVVVMTSCYSAGFMRALQTPDTVVMAASDPKRRSHGCGVRDAATFFGRAWMIEGLNETTDMIAAFESAKSRIAMREKAEKIPLSMPRIFVGERIAPRLRAWQSQLAAAPPVPFVAAPSTAAPASPAPGSR